MPAVRVLLGLRMQRNVYDSSQSAETGQQPVANRAAARNHPHRCRCSICADSDTCTTNHKCVYSVMQSSSGHLDVQYGCVNRYPGFDLLHEAISCNSNQHLSTCCEGDMCNADIDMRLPSTQSGMQSDNSGHQDTTVKTVAIPSIIFILMVIISVVVYRRCRNTAPLQAQEEVTSGHGSGASNLVQISIAKQITLHDQISQGKFGSVWTGVYQGQHVAVKIFNSRDFESWDNETQIYTTLLLRHENIVCFVASDVISRFSCTEYWLITYYHSAGSLYDYLKSLDPTMTNEPNPKCITQEQCLRMLSTAAAGLVHLHSEIHGRITKPAIAHRDIKSKNILVKIDGACCIADLGGAVRGQQQTETSLPKIQVGTKRYMAPEVLSMTLQVGNIDSLKKTDVYSFSLVVWEVMHCSENYNEALSPGSKVVYELPFQGMVQNDPSIDDMHQVVVVQKRRPPLPLKWTNSQKLHPLVTLLTECWSENPQVRHTMLRIRKTLDALHHDNVFKDGRKVKLETTGHDTIVTATEQSFEHA